MSEGFDEFFALPIAAGPSLGILDSMTESALDYSKKLKHYGAELYLTQCKTITSTLINTTPVKTSVMLSSTLFFLLFFKTFHTSQTSRKNRNSLPLPPSNTSINADYGCNSSNSLQSRNLAESIAFLQSRTRKITGIGSPISTISVDEDQISAMTVSNDFITSGPIRNNPKHTGSFDDQTVMEIESFQVPSESSNCLSVMETDSVSEPSLNFSQFNATVRPDRLHRSKGRTSTRGNNVEARHSVKQKVAGKSKVGKSETCILTKINIDMETDKNTGELRFFGHPAISKILNAIRAGGAGPLGAFSFNGVSVNSTITIKSADFSGTLLHFVVKFGNSSHSKIFRALSLKHADLEAVNDCGETPLWFACRQKNESAIAALISLGADLNSKNCLGKTLFMSSCFNQLHDSIYQIMNHQTFDPNVSDICGESHLHYIFRLNQPSPFKFFLALPKLHVSYAEVKHLMLLFQKFDESGVYYNIFVGFILRHFEETRHLHYAVLDKFPSLMASKFIVANMPLSIVETGYGSCSYYGVHPESSARFLMLLSSGDVNAIRLLIKLGVNFKETISYPHRKSSSTYLHHLARSNTKNFAIILQILTYRGISIDGLDSNGETSLFSALRTDNSHAFKALLDAGINWNMQNYDGESIAMVAVGLEKCWALEILFKMPSFNPNHRDKQSRHLIHYLIIMKNFDFYVALFNCRKLLLNGADINEALKLTKQLNLPKYSEILFKPCSFSILKRDGPFS